MASSKALSWNEIRTRANSFAASWQGVTAERAEAQTFWNEWFEVFGISRRQFVRFEQQATRTSTMGKGRADAFWPRMVIVEHKSAGQSLPDALEQALDYLDSFSVAEQPRLAVASDFQSFLTLDLETGAQYRFSLAQFPDEIERFGFIAGYRPRSFKEQDAVNIEAAELMGTLYDALEESGYRGHHLSVFLVRLVFVLFADDTGVWERGMFSEFLETRTALDGTDLGPLLGQLFETLDTPEEARQTTLDASLTRFPYINGGLFGETLRIPSFNRSMRDKVLRCAGFDWSQISPAIFGSLFQSVMEPEERRALGAHYTTEASIMKVISPLFMDELRDAFTSARNSVSRLRSLLDRMLRLTFLDPAAGCGNFLVISYRELRTLEREILVRLRELTGTAQFQIDPTFTSADVSRLHVGQFYAIEIEEFPARIAQTAMYLIDHLENRRLALEFGGHQARFPITDEAHVVVANALRMRWEDLLPREKCTYLLGNPPFTGMYLMTPEQQADNRVVFEQYRGIASRTGRLDYVACWYAKAIDYMRGTKIRAGFVSTNSLTQGEQVRTLGPLLLNSGMRIDFAHRTFRWSSEARGKAAVHVVIVGFSYGGLRAEKLLFDYPSSGGQPVSRVAANINPYLVDAPDVVPAKRSTPLLPALPEAIQGSKPWDDGALLVESSDLAIVMADPKAAKYLRPLKGAKELIHGLDRWCLWLDGADPTDIDSSPLLRRRLEHVREFRLKSRTVPVRRKASTPGLFAERRQPGGRYLAIPQTSSAAREYLPMDFYTADVIATNALIVVPGATDYLFGILQSNLFRTWVSAVSGRLKSDFQIAAGTVYNTFPFPEASESQQVRISGLADKVMMVRATYTEATLATLYDPVSMPAPLASALAQLDRAVEALFGLKGAPVESDKLKVLFERYLALASPLMPSPKGGGSKRLKSLRADVRPGRSS